MSSSTAPLNPTKKDALESMDFSDIILTTNLKNIKQKGRLCRILILLVVLMIFIVLSVNIFRSVSELYKLKEGTAELDNQIEVSIAEKEKKQSIIDGYNAQYNKLKEELEQLTNSIKDLEKEIEVVTKENENYEREIKELSK